MNKKNTRWNVFLMLEEAKKYTCRKQFRSESSYCCKLAYKLGMFEIFTDHIRAKSNRILCYV